MREKLEAVIDELRARKRAGETTVFLGDDTLTALRDLRSDATTSTVPPPAPTRTTASQAAPATPDFKAPPADALMAAFDAEMKAPPARTPPTKTPAPQATAKPASTLPPPPEVTLPEGDAATQWAALRDLVLSDPECQKHVKPGKKVVFGVGSVTADVFFCGEAPGAEEEIQGEPFVGPAGQLLTKIIQTTGLARADVYIGNIMNWRPEMPTSVGNRPPTAEEMAYCLPYLRAQVAIIRPKLIVALGATAISGLTGMDPKDVKVGKMRGTFLDFDGIPLMPTYHPSYLLRNTTHRAKRAVWEDMLRVMEKVGMPVTEKQRGYFL